MIQNKSGETCIVILAAGGSKRLGYPKQLLPWKDTVLLNHVISTAEQIGVDKMLVVLGAYYNEIKAQVDTKNKHLIINNINWTTGINTSIGCALNYINKTGWNINRILFLLGDQPLISTAYLLKLLNSYKTKEFTIAATMYGNQAGVPAVFGRIHFEELAALKPNQGAQSVIQKHLKTACLLKNPETADIDTKEDYVELFSKYGKF